MGLGIGPEVRVQHWQERAATLEKGGVSTSHVYGTYEGLLYTDFIESSLIDYLNLTRRDDRIIWAAHTLFKLGRALDRLQVHAISLLPDLRTDGEKIYVVDFGEDLGELPGKGQHSFYCKNLLRRELINYGFRSVVRKIDQWEVGRSNGADSASA